MPVFIAKYNEIREEKAREFETVESEDDYAMDLLCTIKVPRNLRLLSDRLPKSNYGVQKKLDFGEVNHSQVISKNGGLLQVIREEDQGLLSSHASRDSKKEVASPAA